MKNFRNSAGTIYMNNNLAAEVINTDDNTVIE